jgi:hypothetical protein
MLKDGKLLWSGEHWILYLRRPGEASNSASVGVYHTRFSEAGEGSVALVSIPGDPALTVAVTDSLDLHKFTMERVRAGAPDDPFNNLDFTVKEGRVYRQGDVRDSPSWVIEYDDTRIVATWSNLVEPVIMGDLPPAPDGKTVTFSVLMFADVSTITVDGVQAPGEVFERSNWRKNTGPDGPATSCCFALAETYTTTG